MSVPALTLKLAAAVLLVALVPIPGQAVIDPCTYANPGCVPTQQGFPPSNPWSGFWNTSPTYGVQLVVHQEYCDQMIGMPGPVEPTIISPDPVTAPNLDLCGPPGPGPTPDTPTPIPVVLPDQVMEATSFWDGTDAYVLGGVKDLGGTELSSITKFSRGMPQGPTFGPSPGIPYTPNAPGGEINPANSLPKPLGRQALAYDPDLDMAYTFAGTNGGALNNEIYSFYPPSQLVTTMNCVLPRQFDYMAGAWAEGAAYVFGGRYLEGDGNLVPFSLHTSNEIYRFDPASCTVSLNPNPLPPNTAGSITPEGKRYDMEAVTVGSDIYLFGGTWLDDVACSTPTEVSNGACVYSPLCPTVGPCPVPECSIMKFTPSTGVTTIYQQNFTPLCGSLSAVYDGRYIFIFNGGPFKNLVYRYDPTTPTVAPVFASGMPTGAGSPTKADDYSRGGFVGTTAISTGCSAYLFGGLVDGIPVTAPPDGPISDKITWFGKCKPQAVLQPTYAFTCPNYPIWFDARDSIVGEADFKWAKWNFGDPGSGALNVVQGRWFAHPYDWYNQYAFVPHVFSKEGIYTVTVTVTDFNGLSSYYNSGLQSTATAIVPIRQDSSCDGFTGTKHNDPSLRWPFGVSLDSDLDGIPDLSDNCPSVANFDQADTNGDGMGDACTVEAPVTEWAPVTETPVVVPLPDADHDGVPDVADDCQSTPNHDQADMDADRKGDVCDIDIDGDGVRNSGPTGAFLDNCPWYANPDQLDSNNDGVGDECSYLSSGGSARDASPVGASATQGVAGMSWTTAATMAVVGAVLTVGLLMLLLRRRMRPE
ncbi:MAG: thrombospondin type 3 repeat-containing protein [bacterium]